MDVTDVDVAATVEPGVLLSDEKEARKLRSVRIPGLTRPSTVGLMQLVSETKLTGMSCRSCAVSL